MLLVSANACDGCPKNPFNKNRKAANERLVVEWEQTIEWGSELLDLVELNLIREELSPEEVIIMRSVLHYRKVQNMEIQADLIATRMVSLSMGAGGKKK